MRFNKKTIVSISLCLAVMFMVVGYSILSTKLKISGGANITSTWNIHVSGITTSSVTGDAYNFEQPSYTENSAKFKVMFVNPGDAITYNVTITNSGTLTGVLNNIKISSSGSDAIIYDVYGVKTGTTIAAGETKTLTVNVEYSSNLVVDPDERLKTLTVGLEWVQYTNQVMPEDTYTVKFNANGGTCDSSSNTCSMYDSSSSCYFYSSCTKTGYSHLGWATSPDGPKVYEVYDIISNVVSPGETFNLYAVWGKITDFDYTGGSQTFVVPVTGYYRLEVWGAQGGTANTTYYGGYGGYSRGEIYLEKGTNVYVLVGGQGTSGYPTSTYSGGYNGGGSVTTAGTTTNRYVASGGGATHMSTYYSGSLRYHGNSTTALEGLLIVAGGGGGAYAHLTSTTHAGIGGYGGGYLGGNGAGGSGGYYGLGGSQTAAGYANGATSVGLGGFGYGGNVTYSNPHGSAGGGGFYGGGASQGQTGTSGNSSGGGGSGWIANPKLTNKYMYCYTGCTTSSTESTRTYATGSVNETATSYATKKGNGHARITQLTVQ